MEVAGAPCPGESDPPIPETPARPNCPLLIHTDHTHPNTPLSLLFSLTGSLSLSPCWLHVGISRFIPFRAAY